MGPSHSSGSILHTRVNNLLCERGSNGPVMVIHYMRRGLLVINREFESACGIPDCQQTTVNMKVII